MSLDYPVILKKSEEGYAVGCPALPGCWSQGETEEKALQNIRIAIQEYLEVLQDNSPALRFTNMEHLNLRSALQARPRWAVAELVRQPEQGELYANRNPPAG